MSGFADSRELPGSGERGEGSGKREAGRGKRERSDRELAAEAAARHQALKRRPASARYGPSDRLVHDGGMAAARVLPPCIYNVYI